MERQVHDSQPISRIPISGSRPPRARARNQHKDLWLASMPDARSFNTIISGNANGEGSACEPTFNSSSTCTGAGQSGRDGNR